jgi:excisionase family DNA binding protein
VTTTVPPSRLLTLDEVADRLAVSVKTVRRRISTGELPAVRLGPSERHSLRVDQAELERWLYETPTHRGET